MHTDIFKKSALGLLLALSVGNSLAADLYRWVDEDGKVHYTDRVPAEYVEQGYNIISKQGLTIHTIKAAKEERAAASEKSEPKLSEAQLARDRALLMNYGSEAELIETRERKIDELKALIILNEENTKTLENQYRDLTAQAGDHEKQGKEIPDTLLTKLNVTKHKIKVFALTNTQRRQEIDEINQQFKRDLKRYQALQQDGGSVGPEIGAAPAPAQTPPTEVVSATAQQLELIQQITEVETRIANQNTALTQLEAHFKSIFGQLQEQQKQNQQPAVELSREVNELKLKIQQGYLDKLQSNSQLQHLRQQLEGITQDSETP